MNMCIDMCTDMCVHMCAATPMVICIDMCMDICMDMWIDVCVGCDGIANSPMAYDECNVCGGNGETCEPRWAVDLTIGVSYEYYIRYPHVLPLRLSAQLGIPAEQIEIVSVVPSSPDTTVSAAFIRG